MKKFIKKTQLVLLFLLPVVVFFSYHPVISLGSNNYMNYDLSIPEIWLGIFFIVSLPFIKNLIQFYGWKKILVSSLIPLYCSLSAIWSANHLRAILTAGILWLLLFAVLNIVYLLKNTPRLISPLVKIFLSSAVFVSIICWIQCVLDLAGVTRDFTLLCRGCTFTAFGFPHPNGFAIEPQFMGNLLLAPTLLSFYLLFSGAHKNRKQKHCLVFLTFFLTSTTFLTLSRGAVYSLIVGLVVLFVMCQSKRFPIIKYKLKTATMTFMVVFLAFLVSLGADGLFAAASPTTDDFYSGITKAVHQLSLGIIDLRPNNIKQPQQDIESTISPEDTSSSPDSEEPVSTLTTESENIAPNAVKDTSNFNGYVAESTSIRLNLSGLALTTMASSPQYLTIGTGLGSAGIAMSAYRPEELGPKEIVQNEYISILLELGLIGTILIIAILIYAFKKVDKNALLIAILSSFAFSLLFFSGLPNALHVFLIPALFFTKDNLLVKNIIKSHRYKNH